LIEISRTTTHYTPHPERERIELGNRLESLPVPVVGSGEDCPEDISEVDDLLEPVVEMDPSPLADDELSRIGLHRVLELLVRGDMGRAAAHANLIHCDLKPDNLWLETRPEGVRVRMFRPGSLGSLNRVSGFSQKGGTFCVEGASKSITHHLTVRRRRSPLFSEMMWSMLSPPGIRSRVTVIANVLSSLART